MALFIISITSLLVGCAAHRSAGPTAAWARQFGGTAPTPQRVTATLERFGHADRAVRVRMLRSNEPAAYAWPDGSIFVTRGLVDRLDDGELAATIAHELGHLIDAGHIESPSSLAGTAGTGGAGIGDAEQRADAIGVQLLAAVGFTSVDMERMLRDVAAAKAGDPALAASMTRRADRLRRATVHD